MPKYYLNNNTEETITIALSAVREIAPKSSLPLNNKDVEIIKKLKAARKGKKSILDSLALSTIKLEDDSRYSKEDAALSEEAKKELEAKAKADAEAKAEAEAKAKKELEEKLKAEQIAKEEAEKELAKKREEIKKELLKQAKKDKRNFTEEDLEKAIDEVIAAEVAVALGANPELAGQLGE